MIKYYKGSDIDRFIGEEVIIILKNNTLLEGTLKFSKKYYYIRNIGFRKHLVRYIGNYEDSEEVNI